MKFITLILIVVDMIQQKKYLTKYDYKLKGWL